MIPKNSHIVLQAYGNKDILHECAFALLSLCRHQSREELAALHIGIYTDQPEYFEALRHGLNIQYKTIGAALLKQWRGTINFVHRVKIEILRDYVKEYQGQILYLDTDIVFAENINGIFQSIVDGKLYMHIMEGFVHDSDNAILQKLSRFLRGNRFDSFNSALRIPGNVTMWNAGVLGFSTDHAYLLEDVLAFTDFVYPRFQKHVVEQFAFSLYFQNTSQIHTAHTHIYHYWNLKELRPILGSFFRFFHTNDWDSLVQYSQLIQLPEYLQQKANFYSNRSVLDKLLKKKWLPDIPEWELLVQQL
ncbi:MAG TPA: hypothetical protein VL093_07540 [Flavipsychrobacter sp.]|jgi:hypothetical protein|nr:hypothetical protein [Flavipsychrobacter sp.]